jgi:hypothetical protein
MGCSGCGTEVSQSSKSFTELNQTLHLTTCVFFSLFTYSFPVLSQAICMITSWQRSRPLMDQFLFPSRDKASDQLYYPTSVRLTKREKQKLIQIASSHSIKTHEGLHK